MTDENRDIFEEIMQGMQEARQHAQGEIELPEETYEVPDVDIKVLRTSLNMTQEEFADWYIDWGSNE